VTNEQLVFVVPIITASISFVAAVVAVVIGQLLGQRFTRRADERRWDREDTARRRLSPDPPNARRDSSSGTGEQVPI